MYDWIYENRVNTLQQITHTHLGFTTTIVEFHDDKALKSLHKMKKKKKRERQEKETREKREKRTDIPFLFFAEATLDKKMFEQGAISLTLFS